MSTSENSQSEFKPLEKVREKDIELLCSNEEEIVKAKGNLNELSKAFPEFLVALVDAQKKLERVNERIQGELERIMKRHGVNSETAERAFFDPKAKQIMVKWKGQSNEPQPSQPEDEKNDGNGSNPSVLNTNKESSNMAQDETKRRPGEGQGGSDDGSGTGNR